MGDAAKAFGLQKKNEHRRRRNWGANLEYDEAREKWDQWYDRHKHKDRVLQADSPEQEEVDAAYEEKRRRRQQRLARARGQSGETGVGGERFTHGRRQGAAQDRL